MERITVSYIYSGRIINLYEIYFYRDKNGKEPVKEYILGLAEKKDKNSRIKLNKIMDYVRTLSEYGTGIWREN